MATTRIVKTMRRLRREKRRNVKMLIYVYEVSFDTYQDKLKDGSILTDSELSVCVWMKPGNLFYRLYRAAKYLSGYCSRYGDFDSFEFVQNDAWKLHRMVSGLRAC